MTCGTASPAGRNAFTLMELMVVVVLIGILTVLIIPEMKGTYEDALLRSTGRQLVSVCGIAYSRAVSLSQPHRLRLDLQSGRYAIERRVRSGAQEDFIPVEDVPGCEGRLDTRIAIQILDPGAEAPDTSAPTETPAVDSTISFYPDGTADARELLLQDRQGFRLALRINPITARVEIVNLGHE